MKTECVTSICFMLSVRVDTKVGTADSDIYLVSLVSAFMKSQCAGWRRGACPTGHCSLSLQGASRNRGKRKAAFQSPALPATRSALLTGEPPAECLLVNLELMYCPTQLLRIGTFQNNSVQKGREIKDEDGRGRTRVRGEEFQGPVGQVIFSSIMTILVSLLHYSVASPKLES